MTTLADGNPLEVGQLVEGPRRLMTRERMRWYCDALETTALGSGKFVIAEPTIHSDDQLAVDNGLPGIIADGMISTNWISSMLFDYFGMRYVAVGELQTKFIRPIYEDDFVETWGQVTAIKDKAHNLDVWCQTSDGTKCTVGTARVPISY